MTDRLVLNELALEAARKALFDASLSLTQPRQRPREVVHSLGAVGAQLESFLSGLGTACHVLGDSARARGMVVSALLFASDSLDGAAGSDAASAGVTQ